MIGWIGALAFGFCGLPQATRVWRDGHAEGLDTGFLFLWTLGEVFSFVAILSDAPLGYLILNYSLNAIFLAVMWRYKFFPRQFAARPTTPLQIVQGGKP